MKLRDATSPLHCDYLHTLGLRTVATSIQVIALHLWGGATKLIRSEVEDRGSEAPPVKISICSPFYVVEEDWSVSKESKTSNRPTNHGFRKPDSFGRRLESLQLGGQGDEPLGMGDCFA